MWDLDELDAEFERIRAKEKVKIEERKSCDPCRNIGDAGLQKRIFTSCCNVIYMPEQDHGKCWKCHEPVDYAGKNIELSARPPAPVAEKHVGARFTKCCRSVYLDIDNGICTKCHKPVEGLENLKKEPLPLPWKKEEVSSDGEQRFPRDMQPLKRDWKLVLVQVEDEKGHPKAVYMKLWDDGHMTELEGGGVQAYPRAS